MSTIRVTITTDNDEPVINALRDALHGLSEDVGAELSVNQMTVTAESEDGTVLYDMTTDNANAMSGAFYVYAGENRASERRSSTEAEGYEELHRLVSEDGVNADDLSVLFDVDDFDEPRPKMTPADLPEITTRTGAQDYAIAWQTWVGERGDLSMGELAEWGSAFEALAERFGLTDEFRENGII